MNNERKVLNYLHPHPDGELGLVLLLVRVLGRGRSHAQALEHRIEVVDARDAHADSTQLLGAGGQLRQRVGVGWEAGEDDEDDELRAVTQEAGAHGVTGVPSHHRPTGDSFF